MMSQQAHILILPFPAQGHIKPLLSLAALLCHAGLHVTFLNTEHNHRRLSHLQALFTDHFPTLHFESISDGLPTDHPRSPINRIPELISSIMSVTKPLFRQLLADLSRKSERPITCVIADGIMSFAIDFAKDLGIRAIAFRVFPAACFWSFFCLPNLIEEGQVPVGAEDDMDRMVTCIPGMEGFLRRRDLPSICRQQLDDPMYKMFVEETQASALILNTFDDLEAPILSQHLAPLFSKIYTIGPLTTLVRSRIGDDISRSLSSFSSLGPLGEADRSCMTWLDSQPLRSVVYVSFGSLVIMTRGQLMELWHGLVNSGKPFLWVIRRDSIAGLEGERVIPVELQEGPKEMGFFVEWAPQEDVLAHPAVGGLLTHCGWNSILECIVAGVPMICWPKFGDQQINSRLVSEVWRIGLDMKDTCDRSTVEMMIKTLMEDRTTDITKSMDCITKLAHNCVNKDGSSYHNFDNLLEDITKVA